MEKMKLFLVDWRNNYGMDCFIIEAEDEAHVKQLIANNTTVWPGFEITEIIITGKAGTITYPFNQS